MLSSRKGPFSETTPNAFRAARPANDRRSETRLIITVSFRLAGEGFLDGLGSQPLPQQRAVVGQGDLRRLDLRVPLLLPLNRDPFVVADVAEIGDRLADRYLTLAEQDQFPPRALARVLARVLDVDVQEARHDPLVRLRHPLAHPIWVVRVPQDADMAVLHLIQDAHHVR